MLEFEEKAQITPKPIKAGQYWSKGDVTILSRNPVQSWFKTDVFTHLTIEKKGNNFVEYQIVTTVLYLPNDTVTTTEKLPTGRRISLEKVTKKGWEVGIIGIIPYFFQTRRTYFQYSGDEDLFIQLMGEDMEEINRRLRSDYDEDYLIPGTNIDIEFDPDSIMDAISDAAHDVTRDILKDHAQGKREHIDVSSSTADLDLSSAHPGTTDEIINVAGNIQLGVVNVYNDPGTELLYYSPVPGYSNKAIHLEIGAEYTGSQVRRMIGGQTSGIDENKVYVLTAIKNPVNPASSERIQVALPAWRTQIQFETE